MKPIKLTAISLLLASMTGCAMPSFGSGGGDSSDTVVVNNQAPPSVSATAASSAGDSVSIEEYLAGGKQPIIQTFCSDDDSIFSRSTTNDAACQARVAEVFDFCVNDELDGLLTPRISNRQQANATARIVTDCVLAYQEGPSSVAQYRVQLRNAARQKQLQAQ